MFEEGIRIRRCRVRPRDEAKQKFFFGISMNDKRYVSRKLKPNPLPFVTSHSSSLYQIGFIEEVEEYIVSCPSVLVPSYRLKLADEKS